MAENDGLSTPTGALPAAERSTAENLRDVILAPSATFEDVRERPRWLIPLLVVAIGTLVASYFMMPLYEEMQRIALTAREMTEEQRAQAMQQMERFKYVGLAFGPIMVAVISALVGLLLWAWAAISGAREPRYKVAFTAIVYTGVIGILQLIAQAIVVALKGAEQVALEGGPPTFGLALFLERGDMPRILWGLLANVNFFAIWTAVVVAIAGIHAMRMGKGAAYAFAILMWLVGGVMLGFTGVS